MGSYQGPCFSEGDDFRQIVLIAEIFQCEPDDLPVIFRQGGLPGKHISDHFIIITHLAEMDRDQFRLIRGRAALFERIMIDRAQDLTPVAFVCLVFFLFSLRQRFHGVPERGCQGRLRKRVYFGDILVIEGRKIGHEAKAGERINVKNLRGPGKIREQNMVFNIHALCFF